MNETGTADHARLDSAVVVNGTANHSGFSLVEVSVASAVFMVIAGTFISGLVSAAQTQTTAFHYHRAACVARDRIERAQGAPYASLPAMDETQRRVDECGNPDVCGLFLRSTQAAVSVNTTELRVRVWFPTQHGAISAMPVEVATVLCDNT